MTEIEIVRNEKDKVDKAYRAMETRRGGKPEGGLEIEEGRRIKNDLLCLLCR